MINQISDILATCQEHYLDWSRTRERTREIACKLDDINFKVILNKGGYLYPLANCPTPMLIDNSIHVSSDDPRIRNLFIKFLAQTEKGLYHFPNDLPERRFELNFYSNETIMRNKLLEDEKQQASQQDSRWGLKHECQII